MNIDWVPVGHAGTAADIASNCAAGNCGSVPYPYYISKYEVTVSQYAEFLNAVAADDPNGLYNPAMGWEDCLDCQFAITRSGTAGSYSYSVRPDYASHPVTHVSFYDALRFANWLHNGQPTGSQGNATTEDGAYSITLAEIAANSIARNSGANVFLPSENEWYKAAYCDGASANYFDYPAGTDAPTVCSYPTATPNHANCGFVPSSPNAVVDVGAYTGSASPYGTFDQGGNVYEWNEQIVGGDRGFRGGGHIDPGAWLAASNPRYVDPSWEAFHQGFRVSSLVPEPGRSLLVMTGLAGFAARRRR